MLISENEWRSGIQPIQGTFSLLAAACSGGMEICVRRLQREEAWSLGTLPPVAPYVEELESRCHALVAGFQLTATQSSYVGTLLKANSDLRGVGWTIQHLAQLTWLLRKAAHSETTSPIIASVAEPAHNLLQSVSVAAEGAQIDQMRDAGRLFQTLELARSEAENGLRLATLRRTMSSDAIRFTRAGVWYSSLVGEGAARAAARFLVS